MAEYIELTDLWSAPFDYIIDTCGSSVAQGFIERVKEIKPADVRPVVLCKDCDLWNEWDSSGRESLGTYRCSCAEWTTENTTYYTGPDEFCSRGERKDEDSVVVCDKENKGWRKSIEEYEKER